MEFEKILNEWIENKLNQLTMLFHINNPFELAPQIRIDIVSIWEYLVAIFWLSPQIPRVKWMLPGNSRPQAPDDLNVLGAAQLCQAQLCPEGCGRATGLGTRDR